MAEQKMLKITLVKSPIGAVPKHRATVADKIMCDTHIFVFCNGNHILDSITLPDNAATRGQIQQIRHLIKVEEV